MPALADSAQLTAHPRVAPDGRSLASAFGGMPTVHVRVPSAAAGGAYAASSRFSHAFATSQSRFTVIAPTPSAADVSSIVSPPK